MGFPDFPIPKQEKSYISAEDMLAFLDLYSEEFHVKEQIKFQHYVIRVRPKGDRQWEVRSLVMTGRETNFGEQIWRAKIELATAVFKGTVITPSGIMNVMTGKSSKRFPAKNWKIFLTSAQD